MKVILVTVLSIMFLCSGCSSNIKEEQKSIKICSSLNETMTDILAEDFAKQQNVKVEVRHLPAGNLDERLNFLREGKFDVWLGGTPEEYYLAGEQKMLRSYRPREAYKVPAEMRENQWRWTGLYVDYIGFLTNRDRLRELGLYAPETWNELLKPELWEETALADFKNGGRSYGMITSGSCAAKLKLWSMRLLLTASCLYIRPVNGRLLKRFAAAEKRSR